MASSAKSEGRSHVCPTCRKKVVDAAGPAPPHFPFCSVRCQMVDLGRWLDEEYRISEPADQAGGGIEPVKPGESE